MRKVAERLGVGTMSLYTYVPAKAELLDLMLDAVYGEHVEALEKGPPGGTRETWRAAMEAQARAGWNLYLRHPGHDYMLQYALDDFEFGLQRVLDGLERLIEERNRTA